LAAEKAENDKLQEQLQAEKVTVAATKKGMQEKVLQEENSFVNKYFGWLPGKNLDLKRALGLSAIAGLTAGVSGWLLGKGGSSPVKVMPAATCEPNYLRLAAAAVAGATVTKVIGSCGGSTKEDSFSMDITEPTLARAGSSMISGEEANDTFDWKWANENAVMIVLFLLGCLLLPVIIKLGVCSQRKQRRARRRVARDSAWNLEAGTHLRKEALKQKAMKMSGFAKFQRFKSQMSRNKAGN